MADVFKMLKLRNKPKELLIRVHELITVSIISSFIALFVIWYLNYYIRHFLFFTVTVTFLSSIIYPILLSVKPKGKINISNKAVIISGCDSGFGYLTAKKLDKLGFHVFAGCLFPDGVGAQNLKQATSNRLHIIKLDVTKNEDVTNSVAYVNNNLQNNKLWAVICNAGINDGGEISWTDMDTIQRIFDVNTFGVVRLTKAFLPHLFESQGRVVVVTGYYGIKAFFGSVPYCMTKSAAILFCQGLQLEIGYRFGVKVIAVEPWFYRTAITEENTVVSYLKANWNRAPDTLKKYYPDNYIEQMEDTAKKSLKMICNNRPDEVASCMEEAVVAKNPKYLYTPRNLVFRIALWFLSKIPQSIFDLIMSHFMPTSESM